MDDGALSNSENSHVDIDISWVVKNNKCKIYNDIKLLNDKNKEIKGRIDVKVC
jgi:hypothetical protein